MCPKKPYAILTKTVLYVLVPGIGGDQIPQPAFGVLKFIFAPVEERGVVAGLVILGINGEARGNRLTRFVEAMILLSDGAAAPHAGAERGASLVLHRYGDAIAFDRIFIANPDLPRRLRQGFPLTPYNRATFYGGEAAGYTDYPVHDGMATA